MVTTLIVADEEPITQFIFLLLDKGGNDVQQQFICPDGMNIDRVIEPVLAWHMLLARPGAFGTCIIYFANPFINPLPMPQTNQPFCCMGLALLIHNPTLFRQ